jgi:hypothetical protein
MPFIKENIKLTSLQLAWVTSHTNFIWIDHSDSVGYLKNRFRDFPAYIGWCTLRWVTNKRIRWLALESI